MFNQKHWYSYTELREELFREESLLVKEEIVIALDHMEANGHDEADFGFAGRFIFSRKKQEIEQ